VVVFVSNAVTDFIVNGCAASSEWQRKNAAQKFEQPNLNSENI
jgi:hypothetical protein